MDRRTTIKWVLAAGAAMPLRRGRGTEAAAAAAAARGYGTDPNLMQAYKPGELWPLTLTAAQRRLAAVLADLIIPADEHSPGAAAVGVVDFLDEWVSAPYPDQTHDRTIVLDGFAWLDGEALRRSGKRFADLSGEEQRRICDVICDESRAAPGLAAAAAFFARYRDLTAGAFYSTPAGRQDVGYIGNVALTRFEGPPAALLAALNLP